MTPIDTYLADLDAQLRVGRRQRGRLLAEVRDHLDDSVTHHVAADVDLPTAEATAVRDMGPVREIARPSNAAAGTRAMRRAPLVALAAGVAVVGGLVMAARTQPARPHPAAAEVASQVAFFTGMLALQVGVVAGVCAASRVAASWRRPEVPVADRRFVLRSAALSIAAASAGAAAWVAAEALGPASWGGWRVGLVLAAVAEVGGVCAAAAVVGRVRINVTDEATDPGPVVSRSDVLGLGEWAIALVRRHQVVACGAATVVAAYGAMSRAETTLLASIPFGVAEAVAVVVGFLHVGPMLGLRERHRAGERAPT
jgi:hypothetical protein